MIYYLVYLSSATDLYSKTELSQILATSRKNNTKSNITGILIYHDDGSILQVLEGDKQGVINLFQKIGRDDRHRNIVKLIDGTCEDCNFADWSMGFKSVANNEWNEYDGYIRLHTSELMSFIKEKNAKIDTVVKSFIKRNRV